MIYLDFETRSEADIRKVGAWRYAEHPSTEILCMAYAIKDRPVKLWFPELNNNTPDDLFDYLLTGSLIEAHNAFFERAIWKNICVRRFRWQEILDIQWRCSAAKALAHALPRDLGGAGRALGLTNVKSYEGKRIMLKMCKPRKPTKNDSSKWCDDPEDFQTLYKYCMQDVEAERALSKRLRDLNPLEQKVWQLDQTINERGVAIDREGIEAALHLIAIEAKILLTAFKCATKGVVEKASQIQQVVAWVQSQGVEIKDLTKQTVIDLLAKPAELPANVYTALKLRQQLGRASVAKFTTMLAAASPDDRIRDTFMYHGASTGRWSGKLVQMQNIRRGTIADQSGCIQDMKTKDHSYFTMMYGDDVMGAISSCIRGMLTAAPGHDLVVADYSAIEARVLFWLAGEAKGLKLYRAGEDLYVDMAKVIYKKEDINKLERTVGKHTILGCGYQMGFKRFVDTCKKVGGIEIDEQLATHSVNAYRSKYRSVVKFWYAQERAAIQAVRTGRSIVSGNIKWGVLEGFLYCRLPSGRCLAFYDPEVKLVEGPHGGEKLQLSHMAQSSITKTWHRQPTYGGRIVENITQAVARDLMAEAMLRCEDAGYPIVMHVHDELVAEVPTGFGSVKAFEQIMEKLPAWAKDCPVKAEGWRGKRYKK